MRIIKKVVIGLTILILSFSVLVFINNYHEPELLADLNTEYTQGFSYEKLERVKQGISKQQVLQILGEPFWTEQFGDICLVYSRRNSFSRSISRFMSFGVRTVKVCFDVNGKYIGTFERVFD